MAARYQYSVAAAASTIWMKAMLGRNRQGIACVARDEFWKWQAGQS